MSYRKACSKFGVPVMTIQNRISGKVDELAHAGRPTVIPAEVEVELVEKIKRAANMGFGITRRMLLVKIGRIVRKLGIKSPFRNGVPGKDWIAGFLKRHPDVSLRTPQALSTCRARMLNETVTNNYFNDLAWLLESLCLQDKPVRIWNIDETSVPLLHKPARVLGPSGAKNIPGRVGNNRENVSVLACVNAAGGEIPPLVIVKGKTYKSLLSYNTEAGVPGSVYTFQERAWMEDTLGEIWFRGHFLKHCGPARPQLIILDSHSSHETLGLIDAAIANDVHLLAFPPHTTQWLCPLDKSVFGPLSREYSRFCTEFMALSPNNMVNKWEWPRLFRQAHDKSFSITNIVSGFRKCGIYPVDRNAIPKTALAPSVPFDVQLTTTNITTPSGVDNVVAQQPDPRDHHTEVLETAHDGIVLNETELIGLVTSGQYPCTVDPVSGNLEISLELFNGQPMQQSVERRPFVHDWSVVVDQEFALPTSERTTGMEKPSSRKLTSHRILTSEEIVKKKREDK
ncbi:uncharacterized protein LOC127877190 [Dreissena polymorpha]|uniref:uncharacterized protein LOC127877190 n=1 Tax=Dreissena polymorpha TaxID=45954 RepID=UPI002263B330|nr:uncharacterized protein LOC127877190 [Dreissena polymorpha]